MPAGDELDGAIRDALERLAPAAPADLEARVDKRVRRHRRAKIVRATSALAVIGVVIAVVAALVGGSATPHHLTVAADRSRDRLANDANGPAPSTTTLPAPSSRGEVHPVAGDDEAGGAAVAGANRPDDAHVVDVFHPTPGVPELDIVLGDKGVASSAGSVPQGQVDVTFRDARSAPGSASVQLQVGSTAFTIGDGAWKRIDDTAVDHFVATTASSTVIVTVQPPAIGPSTEPQRAVLTIDAHAGSYSFPNQTQASYAGKPYTLVDVDHHVVDIVVNNVDNVERWIHIDGLSSSWHLLPNRRYPLRFRAVFRLGPGPYLLHADLDANGTPAPGESMLIAVR